MPTVDWPRVIVDPGAILYSAQLFTETPQTFLPRSAVFSTPANQKAFQYGESITVDCSSGGAVK